MQLHFETKSPTKFKVRRDVFMYEIMWQIRHTKRGGRGLEGGGAVGVEGKLGK